ncbi:hypothetical protein V6Z12_A04G161000 [Gossypium hirsutum]
MRFLFIFLNSHKLKHHGRASSSWFFIFLLQDSRGIVRWRSFRAFSLHSAPGVTMLGFERMTSTSHYSQQGRRKPRAVPSRLL